MYSVQVSVVRCMCTRTSGWWVSTLGAHAVALGAEAIGNRILDLEGRKIQAGQRAVLGRHLDLEGFFGR